MVRRTASHDYYADLSYKEVYETLYNKEWSEPKSCDDEYRLSQASPKYIEEDLWAAWVMGCIAAHLMECGVHVLLDMPLDFMMNESQRLLIRETLFSAAAERRMNAELCGMVHTANWSSDRVVMEQAVISKTAQFCERDGD